MVAARITTDAETVTMLTPQQLDTAIEFLIRLKSQLRLIAVSYGDLVDAMARGDVALIFSGWEALKSFAAAKGKVIEYTHPKEGTTAFFDSYCFPKNAPNREVDHALANKIIDVPAQLKIGNEDQQGIVNLEAIDQLEAAAPRGVSLRQHGELCRKSDLPWPSTGRSTGGFHLVQRLEEGVSALQECLNPGPWLPLRARTAIEPRASDVTRRYKDVSSPSQTRIAGYAGSNLHRPTAAGAQPPDCAWFPATSQLDSEPPCGVGKVLKTRRTG